jgi:small subunit ribosomal protein S1
MAEYLEAHSQVGGSLRRGDVVTGTVVLIGKDGILVDVGAKSEGLVPNEDLAGMDVDLRERVHVGDEVPVYVVRPESQDGHIILSLKRGAMEREWQALHEVFERGDIFEGKVIGYNKGGLIVSIDGIRGFIPVSQLASLPKAGANGSLEERLAEMTERTLWLKIIEMNRRQNRLILSERLAMHEWRSQQKERLVRELKEGQLYRGRVSSICDFGVFVDLGGGDGLIPLSELSWSRVKHPSEVLAVGDEVETYVMSVDPETKRIALSLRRAQPSPWDTINERYQVGQLVQATITKLAKFGAFARLEDGIEGLIHISELDDRRIEHPKEVVQEGANLTLRIISIDPQRQRLGLSLKQAEEALNRWQGVQDVVGSGPSGVSEGEEAHPDGDEG